ncbi:MAG: Para-aminobenzoate synthase, aminase component [Candidatus Carbobacillus altaicus]|uniref:Para-aminobenzoate synthase, aminase component n=1 Tax=Candidatus Carbonibacillus altaicus TaxID=2163959 RepID=A0A2R6XXP0_9BACL|nr:MAG: Para-aminobenzoate synthase, aminase component [Candidatus Carbobacillus altaicus]
MALSSRHHTYTPAHAVHYEVYFPGLTVKADPAASPSILEAHSLKDVLILLQLLEERRQAGWCAIGFLTYEAGYAFWNEGINIDNDVNKTSAQLLTAGPSFHDTPYWGMIYQGTMFDGLPLAWFVLLPPGTSFLSRADSRNDTPSLPERSFSLGTLEWPIDHKTYTEHVHAIQKQIQKGALHELNYTAQAKTSFDGDPLTFFHRLRALQKGLYHAYIDLGDWVIASVSPELFFSWQEDTLIMRPMKGTARRGRFLEEDRCIEEELRRSYKNRTENELTVQGMLSEMKALAPDGEEPEVSSAFDIETYPHIFQMTSTLKTRLRPEIGLPDIFEALFPSGSIAGYPKGYALNITRRLEKTLRGLYTGTIGIITPDQIIFNIAIRTALIHRPSGTLTFGSGSGITLRSRAEEEYAEMKLKANILDYARIHHPERTAMQLPTQTPEQVSLDRPVQQPQHISYRQPIPFALLETMRLEHGRFPLLDRHLKRLEKSMRYFRDRYTDPDGCIQHVQEVLMHVARRHAEGVYRLRLIAATDVAGPSDALGPFDSLDLTHTLESTRMYEQNSYDSAYNEAHDSAHSTAHKTSRSSAYSRGHAQNAVFHPYRIQNGYIYAWNAGVRIELSKLTDPWDKTDLLRPSLPASDSVNIPSIPVYLAHRPIDANDPRYFHKTLDRAHYETFLSQFRNDRPHHWEKQRQHRLPGHLHHHIQGHLHHYLQDCEQSAVLSSRVGTHMPFDVLLYNQHGHITELTRANLVIQRGRRYLTPPLEAGLLPGVFRQTLLEAGEIEESVLLLDDLKTADHIWAINALRGWMRVKLF